MQNIVAWPSQFVERVTLFKVWNHKCRKFTENWDVSFEESWKVLSSLWNWKAWINLSHISCETGNKKQTKQS